MKNLPDLVVCHPLHLDYPLWREMIKEDDITFLDCLPIVAGEDWRNKAVNMALSISNSEWVYFTEQDFIPVPEFWREVTDLMKRADVFGKYEGNRLHPCCFFIKRELLNRTSKDFGANGDKGYDHFALIQKWINSHNIICGVIFSQFGHHMNGLSQNLHMLQIGLEPNYQPERFKEYCKQCLLLDDLHPAFEKLFKEYLKS